MVWRGFDWLYHDRPWDMISIGNRRRIIAERLGRPVTCPSCGRQVPVCLWTKDGKYPDDNSNYYWSCKFCKGRADQKKNRNPPHIHIKK